MTIGVMQGQQVDQVAILKARVIKGNQVLYDAWKKSKTMVDDPVKWDNWMEQIHQKYLLLDSLCTALKALGYNQCLYTDNRPCYIKDGRFCFVCPRETMAPKQESLFKGEK